MPRPLWPPCNARLISAEWRTDCLAMIRWQRSITVGVFAKVSRCEQFSRHLSHRIDDFAGFEDPLCDERLDQSFPFAREIYRPLSSLRFLKAQLGILDSLVSLL